MRWDRFPFPIANPKAQKDARASYREARSGEEGSDSNQLFAGGSEHVAALLGHDQHVFNTNAPFAGNVGAGLDRHDHPGLQDLRLPGGDPWGLMNLQSHSVPGGVGKPTSQTGFLQHISGCPVHFPNRDPGSHSFCSRSLRLAQYEGRFTSRWSDVDVVNIGSRLIAFGPMSDKPMEEGSVLAHVGGHEFKIDTGSEFGYLGEKVAFQFDRNGRLTGLSWGPNPMKAARAGLRRRP